MTRIKSARIFRLALLATILVTLIGSRRTHAQLLFDQADDNSYFWMRHVDGRQVGDLQPFSSAGGTHFRFLDNGVLAIAGQGLITNNGDGGASIGINRRFFLGNSIFGAGLWYDVSQTQRESVYHQTAVSLEWFVNDEWTVRANGYLPVGPRVRHVSDVTRIVPESIGFLGNSIRVDEQTLHLQEEGLKGIDIEIARAISDFSSEVFVGYTNFQGRKTPTADGVKVGVRGYLTPRLAAQISIANDPVFGTNCFGGLTWFFGGSGGEAYETLDDKLLIPVQRNHQVVVNEVLTETSRQSIVLTDGGNPISVAHINDHGAGGDGSFEAPFGSLAAAAGSTTDIVYIHSGTVFVGGPFYQLSPGQRFLGEGNNNQHVVQSDQLGPVNLPAANGIANLRPEFNVGGSVTLADSNTEISNFDINGGNAVLVDNVSGMVDINRLSQSGGIVGIGVSSGDASIDISGVTITDSWSGLEITGGSSTVSFSDRFGTSSITTSLSTSWAMLVAGHTGSIDFPVGNTITATDGLGMLFFGANGIYTFDGAIRLSNGADITISGGSGTFTFSDTIITP